MVFYDHLIFSLVFSKLQGSSQNDYAQIRTGTNRKIGIMIIWMLFSIVKSYCLCCCEVLGPQLFFDFTLGLKKKKDLNHWMSSSCAAGFQQVVRTRLNPSLKWALRKAYKQADLNKDCSQTKTETHSRDQSTGWYLYSRWSEMQKLYRRPWKVHNRSKTRQLLEGMW